MGIAVIYALSEGLRRDWVVIPQVAQTHGVLNALGFSLCGILGWLIEFATVSTEAISGAHPLPKDRTVNLRVPQVHVLG